jgi:hypothetical protein
MQEDAMTRCSRLACVGAFLLASLAAAVAMGATIDKRTTFTFNTPVAVPGVTLPAGSYLFRIADTDTHKIVQVLSADGRIPYSMFFVLEAWRPTPSADPELTFIETAADMPHAIRTWWHPGESIGYDFLYPREQARRLARGSGTPVPSIDTDVPVWTEPTLIPPTFETAPPPAVTAPAVVEPAPYAEPAVEPEPAPEELPKTASPVTVAVATAIALVAMAAAMQRLVSRKRT